MTTTISTHVSNVAKQFVRHDENINVNKQILIMTASLIKKFFWKTEGERKQLAPLPFIKPLSYMHI